MLRTDVHIRGDELIVMIELPDDTPGEIEFVIDSALFCLRLRPSERFANDPRTLQRPKDCYEFVPLPVRVRPQEIEAALYGDSLEVRLTIEKNADEVIHYRFPRGSQNLRREPSRRRDRYNGGLRAVPNRTDPTVQSISEGGTLCGREWG